MKAITSVVRFITAQFKDHTQKLVRRTYLIPPPSAVAGFFGAILGLSRKELWENSDKLLAGAELRSLEGRAVSICRIFKIDRPIKSLIRLLEDYHKLGTLSERKRKEVINGIQGLLTIKESEELYMAEYKFAVASTNEQLIEEGAERLKELDFEYEVFGGNDYNFVEYVGGVRRAKLIKSTKGRGYCKLRDFEKLETGIFAHQKSQQKFWVWVGGLGLGSNPPLFLLVLVFAALSPDDVFCGSARLINDLVRFKPAAMGVAA